jgi:putative transposase
VKRVGPLVSGRTAFVERFVQTLRTECLDHFVVLGEQHLARLVRESVAHDHEERPHLPLPWAASAEPQVLRFPSGEIKCRGRLGGLLKHYFRAAA